MSTAAVGMWGGCCTARAARRPLHVLVPLHVGAIRLGRGWHSTTQHSPFGLRLKEQPPGGRRGGPPSPESKSHSQGSLRRGRARLGVGRTLVQPPLLRHQLGPSRPELAQIRPTSSGARPESSLSQPKLARHRPSLAQIRHKLARCRPTSARTRPPLAWSRGNLARHRPDSAKVGPTTHRVRPNPARHRPNLARNHQSDWEVMALHRPNLTRALDQSVDQSWPGSWPEVDQTWPKCGHFRGGGTTT